jgi:hypothetical protein
VGSKYIFERKEKWANNNIIKVKFSTAQKTIRIELYFR